MSDDWGDEPVEEITDDWGEGEVVSEEEDAPVIPESRGEFSVLEETEMVSRMNKLVGDVCGILQVSTTQASMMLRSHGWNKEKLMQKYLEGSTKFLSDSGLQFVDVKEPAPPEGSLECIVCTYTVPGKDTAQLGCGHRFCFSCWREYLTERISRGRQCLDTRCMLSKCNVRVPDGIFKRFLKEEGWIKFQEWLRRSFVEDNKRMKWCPGQRCARAIESQSSTAQIHCRCGHRFCFSCGDDAHAPITCEQLRTWLAKCDKESETAMWIMANTRRCPKCSVRIEKNQGCNHMVCQQCKHEFCWVCEGPWAEHGNQTGGFYRCNKYDPKEKSSKDKKSTTDSKRDLDRYLFYYQRYHNHDQSKKFADRQRQVTEERMLKLQEQSDHAWMEVQFLKAATEQVILCRQVLKYTYVFAYFLPEGQEKTLFEFLQQQLETTTEQLSELSEQPVDKIVRQDVANFTHVTDKFLRNLLAGVRNGLTNVA